MNYGPESIVAEVQFKMKMRHLIFKIGKDQKAIIKGKKIDDPELYPV